jgi:hypothetical protein
MGKKKERMKENEKTNKHTILKEGISALSPINICDAM